MLFLPKLIYSFYAFPVIIQGELFGYMGKLILKCMYKGKGIRTTENEKIWKKIIGKITSVGLSAYYKSAAIKTLWVDKERDM